jgi:DNA-binding NarL/FixJ family response regulator
VSSSIKPTGGIVKSPDFPNPGETHEPVRVLVVEDHDDWVRYVSGIVASQPGWRVIGQARDGLEAVHMAERLQPDLILLDIGLPKLNGLEAARQIHAVVPTAKVLFVSENRSGDIVEAALANGAGGYVLKADAGGDLLRAIRAVLEGKRFISASLTGQLLVTTTTLSVIPVAQLSWLLMFISGIH